MALVFPVVRHPLPELTGWYRYPLCNIQDRIITCGDADHRQTATLYHTHLNPVKTILAKS